MKDLKKILIVNYDEGCGESLAGLVKLTAITSGVNDSVETKVLTGYHQTLDYLKNNTPYFIILDSSATNSSESVFLGERIASEVTKDPIYSHLQKVKIIGTGTTSKPYSDRLNSYFETPVGLKNIEPTIKEYLGVRK